MSRPTVWIAPSVLAADFTRLGEQVREAQEGGADLIHVDVMDGRFVPNISMGIVVVEAIRRVARVPLDVHLMIVEPEKYLADFVQAGATYLTFHAEATPHAHRAVQRIRELGAKPGLALNPATPLSFLEPLLPDLDLALLMTVNPGFGGQKFIPSSTQRLRELRTLRDRLNPACLIEVDGGITPQTVAQVSGADILVAGSSVFNARSSIRENINTLRKNYALTG
ncbi:MULTISPECIES: ribulose-phosphate 3-epimerase [unclassified Meiothermus]|uniref:ribulose-phosphate 3-epimerase n=1 Tax=unclassified Meiothermus TaxID=370471 RepID=UPI000D7C94C6|nr:MULTISPECIES: ribulose-phosphate 3-epimerase [unclassified Meiothermus]PZA07402.1 ribulose-phosphate 3-epimerase [Meiothermus sp. Pnk-1]RYM30226.1 ribulose-phosphate 3-epimerase [Meiothermus sp. PNK-Is4]